MDVATFVTGFAAGCLVAGVLAAVIQRRKLAQMEELFDRMFDLQARRLFPTSKRLSKSCNGTGYDESY